MMELSLNVKNMIEERLADCEKQYSIRVLFWAFRGSLDIGISRKNSDLDLIFIFKNTTKDKVVAIHDIIGYGFDFWGWDIEDAIKTIEINNKLFYEKGNYYKELALSKEHARGGLTYYFGIYCCFYKEKSGNNIREMDVLAEKIIGVMEKRVLITNIMSGVKNKLIKLDVEEEMSSCDYLYTVWRILFAEHIYKGGAIGECEIDFLMSKYVDEKDREVINRLRRIYKKSLSKHSQSFAIAKLNAFLYKKANYLDKALNELKPEHNWDFQERVNDIRMFVGKLGLDDGQ